MRNAIVIAIAAWMTSLFALMFWQVEAGGTAAVVEVPQKPEYAVTSNPYLPIEWLRPAW
jgi:hypothetical protein